MSLEQLLAYLRLSAWDANILLGCFPALMEHVGYASEPLKEEMYWVIKQVWDTYYPLGEQADLAFHLGTLLCDMQYYPDALDFFQHSRRLYGPKPDAAYGMGRCYYELRQLDHALACVRQALQLDPECEPARALRLVVESAISRQVP